MDYNKVIALVYEARRIVFEQELKTENKNANPYDFVTAVDVGISDFLKLELAKLFPDVGFMTEEEASHNIKNKMFILDPIDGTTNLVYGYKKSSISLAYSENGEVKFGVVFDPYAKEMFFAVEGCGAHLFNTAGGIDSLLRVGVTNYEKNLLRVNNHNLKQSLIEFGASSSHKDMADETFSRAKRIFEKCLDIRRICSTALAISYIAAGRLDGYFEKIIKPWDYAAAVLILEEAGGKATDWFRASLPLDREGTIVCSNTTNYEELINLINL